MVSWFEYVINVICPAHRLHLILQDYNDTISEKKFSLSPLHLYLPSRLSKWMFQSFAVAVRNIIRYNLSFITKVDVDNSTGWSKKNVTFVRFWVFDLGRGVFRGSFSPEIDWWWSQVPYMCPSCEKHVFFAHNSPVFAYKIMFLHPKTITFVRICVFDFGRGNIRNNFPPKIYWWWSHMPHTCFPCWKQCFVGKKNTCFMCKNMCFPH